MSETVNDEKRETIAEVVADMRKAGALMPAAYMRDLLNYADRIESAWKREKAEWEAAACACVSDAVMSGRVAVEHVPIGNAAALRQAVVKALTLLQVCTWPSGVSLDGVAEVVHEIDSALDKPPRNCDIGTPDEQGVRCLATMRHWRKAYQGDALITAIMKWLQDPYKDEGGAK